MANWFNKLQKLAQEENPVQDMHARLNMIDDYHAEKGHQNYLDNVPQDFSQVKHIVDQIVTPSLIQKISDYMTHHLLDETTNLSWQFIERIDFNGIEVTLWMYELPDENYPYHLENDQNSQNEAPNENRSYLLMSSTEHMRNNAPTLPIYFPSSIQDIEKTVKESVESSLIYYFNKHKIKLGKQPSPYSPSPFYSLIQKFNEHSALYTMARDHGDGPGRNRAMTQLLFIDGHIHDVLEKCGISMEEEDEPFAIEISRVLRIPYAALSHLIQYMQQVVQDRNK